MSPDECDVLEVKRYGDAVFAKVRLVDGSEIVVTGNASDDIREGDIRELKTATVQNIGGLRWRAGASA